MPTESDKNQPSHQRVADGTDQAPNAQTTEASKLDNSSSEQALPPEIGGQKGPEPTRFGDWEKNGRCTDF